MTQPKYRQTEYERMKGVRIVRRIARHKAAKQNPAATFKVNGHVVYRVVRLAQCEMCADDFLFVMTCKPHRFCAACKARREKRRMARRWLANETANHT
jgi:hypothetical protein